ncbi:MAG: hypothetical protein EAZ70_03600 [Runella slithyformis]|nr:MAG: hypothetical protein EAY79_03010 [Runella slithyformis]TAF29013.1 MAG: hypothetical protein EAZ70_03600 [Runella slithyformis]TAF46472.1 MAG: hypothetical protein EAZ63_09520 [Runella slithyformis]TAF82583.1 MAG: hypothetical protein EAZ50_03550 [Runella slithyformis]
MKKSNNELPIRWFRTDRRMLWMVFLMLLWGSFRSFGQKQVLVFFDVECPICQKSSKRVQEMYEQYSQEVDFKLIFPVKSVKKSDIRKFKREYLLTIPTVRDRNHTLVEQYDAKVTPEVIVLDNNGSEYYRGAIDNQFFELGKNRPKMTEFYLKDALDGLLNNQPKPQSYKAVGCIINRKKTKAVNAK